MQWCNGEDSCSDTIARDNTTHNPWSGLLVWKISPGRLSTTSNAKPLIEEKKKKNVGDLLDNAEIRRLSSKKKSSTK